MYHLTWVTEQLAVGHAPMSYDELDSIRFQGIDAIVNLCGEYCDLHDIERSRGFEVYYLPVEDNEAPRLEALEKALDWLDESVYLGKKVLIHCRLGIGRTGTFITSYLLRRGFGMKLAGKRLKKLRSSPSSFSQWWFLRKYGKRAGTLAIREPSLEGARVVDLSGYFADYELLVNQCDQLFQAASAGGMELSHCGRETDACCRQYLNVQFIEAAYLGHYLNRTLRSEERQEAIHRAALMGRTIKGLQVPTPTTIPYLSEEETVHNQTNGGVSVVEGELAGEYLCPLSVQGQCILYDRRPIACRTFSLPDLCETKEPVDAPNGLSSSSPSRPDSLQKRTFNRQEMSGGLHDMSRMLFYALNGRFLEGRSFLFPLSHVVSGKFVQDYFTLLMQMEAL